MLSSRLLNAVQTTMYALANFALDRGGPPGYFSSWAVTMAVVFASLALVRRHIPGNR